MRYLAGYVSAFYDPLRVPNAPTIGTASSVSATSLSVTFTAPVDTGGGAITSYVATARKTSDSTTVAQSGASSPLLITGLTSVEYTVTVVAVNAFGPSQSTAPSNAVTPVAPALIIGQVFGGGYYAGQISSSGNGVADYNLVVGPYSTANTALPYSPIGTSGPSSDIDGPANSAAMNSATYKAAFFCEGLTIGGFTDWYMPAKNEVEICYYNLKPDNNNLNNTNSGINPNAIPPRTTTYTTGVGCVPGQTSAVIFRVGNAQAFTSLNIQAAYWSSTQYNANYAWLTNGFDSGYQTRSLQKNNYRSVRAMRRVAV
jgi:hypothetical protein